jgi:hypothetical protein
VLVFEGVNRHSSELVEVEQEPVYTEISPAAEMDGMNALVPSLGNGRLDVIVSKDAFEVDIEEDMLRDTNWCCSPECADWRKMYAISLPGEDI